MKSTDKFVLVLVASLALLLAGCGGGSSTTAPPVDPGPTPVEMAEAALTEAQAGVSSDMTDAEMLAAYRAVQSAADNLIMVLKANNGSLVDVEEATTVRENAKSMADNLAMKIADAQVAADKAMMAMAAKLYMAIGTDPLARNKLESATGTDVDDTTGALTVATLLSDATDGPASPLEEDKMTMVAPLYGWVGSQHTKAATAADTTANAGTFTAQMYANVEEPTPGEKFSVQYSTNFDAATGVLDETTTEGTASRVASPRFDQSAGVKTFELPSNNVAVMISGSYHGVSGTYSCDPGDNNSCAVRLAAQGFELGGVVDATNAFDAANAVWTFKPTDPEARLMGTPDAVYAVYGWWLHETDDATTVSAFTALRGAVSTPSALDPLNGTATYMGGAAGKYTIRAGAVNDAGHFTADAELMANFNDDTITGTIDNFMGGDGMSRDWSIALKNSHISTTGAITGTPDGNTAGNQMTTWTMGGTAASDSGEWSGNLYEENDGGVPGIGTGTFHSEYGNIGRMVGAFGVNLEN